MHFKKTNISSETMISSFFFILPSDVDENEWEEGGKPG